MSTGKQLCSGLKELIILWFNQAEDIIYVGLALLLTAIAVTFLIMEKIYFARYVSTVSSTAVRSWFIRSALARSVSPAYAEILGRL